ncbi:MULTISPECIES: hypothetical protein [Clostridium]|uniref:Uncharacterized protein n=1 Tax=Clostridium cadaveris TaxID=1529 RepID=A0A1I2KE27_9CLOT|nr:hypothetical protein [Clostridium cadaveris]MDU4952650.1 hypothetical protein [Clostridium sp.]MDY4950400.1 hypothetical protein [Clostridium cadaveris]NME63450.1 hypothetical protein [Clostridium cadaveris]NWK12309.1 hypothetical protein [Clostridium cadaveris]UFH65735.1 hypothetical protein KQH81_04150 [Clostridium cadaveris]
MNKAPKWVIVFIVIGLMMPIFSIESIIPWILFILLSLKCINISKSSENTKTKVIKCSIYTLASVLLTVGFNVLLTLGMPFIISMIV